MDQVYNDIDYKTPLIFILSPGADPMMNLLVIHINFSDSLEKWKYQLKSSKLLVLVKDKV